MYTQTTAFSDGLLWEGRASQVLNAEKQFSIKKGSTGITCMDYCDILCCIGNSPQH